MGFLKTFSPLGPAIWSAIANIYNIYIFLFQSYLFLDQKRMQIFDNTFFSFLLELFLENKFSDSVSLPSCVTK